MMSERSGGKTPPARKSLPKKPVPKRDQARADKGWSTRGWSVEEEFVAMLWWSDAGQNFLGSAIPEEQRATRTRELLKAAMTDRAFRRQLVSKTKGVLGTLGVQLGPGRSIQVVENTPGIVHVVLPRRMDAKQFEALFPEHDLKPEDLKSTVETFGVALSADFDVHWVGDQNPGDK